jgi:hypothetical protein
VRLVSWLGAKKVLVPDGEAVTLGVTDGAGGAGALGDPAALGDPTGTGDPAGVLAAVAAIELVDEPQAVTSKARQTSPGPVQENTAPAVTCRALRNFVVNIESCPF